MKLFLIKGLVFWFFLIKSKCDCHGTLASTWRVYQFALFFCSVHDIYYFISGFITADVLLHHEPPKKARERRSWRGERAPCESAHETCG